MELGVDPDEVSASLRPIHLELRRFAAVVASPDAVYFTNSDGLTTVVAAEPSYREIGTNDLGEPTMASMAAAGGDLYIRTAAYLYAVNGRVVPTAR